MPSAPRERPCDPADSKPARSGALLSEAIAKGDAKALAEFYRSRFDRLYTLTRSFSGRDESFCLDVIQETMLRVARRMKAMPTDADVDRWTAAVLRSAAVDLLRRERRRKHRERTANSSQSRPAQVLSTDSFAHPTILRAALSTLPPEDALLLKLRFQHDATFEQAGRALNTTGDAAHGRIRRALRTLRSLLSESSP